MGKGDHLGEFEQLILLALATVGDEASGRQVHEEIARATGRDVAVTAVYVTLNRLIKKGHISAGMGTSPPPGGGRVKKLFRLEAAGAAALRQLRDRFDLMWKGAESHPQLRALGGRQQ
ncbi:MAG: PadR family transcriptional regulator [Acidobacteria bacterium]|nr:PadR family transcriptional regulator [Acidobacteriota bacterium]